MRSMHSAAVTATRLTRCGFARRQTRCLSTTQNRLLCEPRNFKRQAPLAAAAVFSAALGVASIGLHTEQRNVARSEPVALLEPAKLVGNQPATSPATSNSEVKQDPFMTPEIQALLQKRTQREAELEVFSRKVKNRMFYLSQRVVRRELSESKYQVELQKLREEILLEANRILYGVEDAHAREEYLKKYGCTRCTKDAASYLARLQPLIEIGAGLGHWNKCLRDLNVEVVSYDSGKSIPLPNCEKLGDVLQGDETVLKNYKDHTLLLVYPPPGPMASACLSKYKGDVLVYVGEERNGCNGDPAFFDELTTNWEIVDIVEIDPFPECFEKMYVLKRVKSSSWWKWW